MDLWIRSQDRERLIKVSTLFVEYNGEVDPTISPYRIVADKCIDLGIYKTKERALEVLDEIFEMLKGTEIIDLMNKTKSNIINAFPIITYEMPKE